MSEFVFTWFAFGFYGILWAEIFIVFLVARFLLRWFFEEWHDKQHEKK